MPDEQERHRIEVDRADRQGDRGGRGPAAARGDPGRLRGHGREACCVRPGAGCSTSWPGTCAICRLRCGRRRCDALGCCWASNGAATACEHHLDRSAAAALTPARPRRDRPPRGAPGPAYPFAPAADEHDHCAADRTDYPREPDGTIDARPVPFMIKWNANVLLGSGLTRRTRRAGCAPVWRSGLSRSTRHAGRGTHPGPCRSPRPRSSRTTPTCPG
jgi:hypothetical protein